MSGVGVALTQAAEGNQTLSLLLTISTNLLGVVTVPWLLSIYYANNSAIKINPSDLILNLVYTVCIPCTVGILLRASSKRISAFVKKHKVLISMISSTNLLIIVWMALSGARDTLIKQEASAIVSIILLAILQHIIYLAYNLLLLKYVFVKIPTYEAIALAIMCSQKSSPVSLAVITYITKDHAQQGLLTIPCVSGQLTQIFLDAAIAKYFKKYLDRGVLNAAVTVEKEFMNAPNIAKDVETPIEEVEDNKDEEIGDIVHQYTAVNIDVNNNK